MEGTLVSWRVARLMVATSPKFELTPARVPPDDPIIWEIRTVRFTCLKIEAQCHKNSTNKFTNEEQFPQERYSFPNVWTQ